MRGRGVSGMTSAVKAVRLHWTSRMHVQKKV
jgi:hypothetical protein